MNSDYSIREPGIRSGRQRSSKEDTMKVVHTVFIIITLGASTGSVVAQSSSHSVSDLNRIVNCVSQKVLTSQNSDEFVSAGNLKFRYFGGGIPLTNQEKEPIETIVLYSTDGRTAIIGAVEKVTSDRVRVLPFFDYLKRSDSAWSPVDVSGGPGTADVTAEFLNKLAAERLQETKVKKVADSTCTVIEPD